MLIYPTEVLLGLRKTRPTKEKGETDRQKNYFRVFRKKHNV